MYKAILKKSRTLYKKIDNIPGGTKTIIILTCFLVIIFIAISSFHEKSLDNWLIAVSNIIMASCAFAALLKVNSYFSSYAAKDAYDAAKTIRLEILPKILAADSINKTCLEIRRKLDVPHQYPDQVKIEDTAKEVNKINKKLTQELNILMQNLFELQSQNKIITDSLKHLEKTSLKEYQDICHQGMFLWRLTTALNIHLIHTLNDIPLEGFNYTSVFKQIDEVLEASSLLLNNIREDLNK
ncbi:hypothetical protein [Klebsiella aerogenes]|uniref:hypothetical protein n=1 Tax=Klebsiella aerogenes TaxID=548 RepID=UPI000DA10B38|nr:hypothetical protein [Klebsiella aerogenes]HBW3015163.1 hypothetical protein [Klebsiella aerogenes]HCB2856852.1 hypothetical protein [Klebsiella aerogenes]HCB2863470.1 hypothetical protein [Klebsiella aerogenes]HCB2880058.1 hypothetical protein [Klebsiella aerogenes]HCB3341463.1 hypothetical protein [Klebsiella aerogenes]